MLTTTLKRTIATALSGAVIAGTAAAPAAFATPNLRPDPAESGDEVAASMASEATQDAGLDLASAAIGAASGTGLLIVVLAAGGLAWRRPAGRRQGATRV